MKKIKKIRGTYYDSVTLMLAAKELKQLEGVEEAVLNMGTESNVHIMKNAGFEVDAGRISPEELIIGIDCEEGRMEEFFFKAEEFLSSPPWKKESENKEYTPASLEGAIALKKDANIVLISVAGRYAADVAFKSLENGLNVMLYSDNVSIEEEVRLKKYADKKNLMVMGPDCGTVMIKGKGLGFCNVCPKGRISLVSASGTGSQEVMVQLSARGAGVLHSLGTGGRDAGEEVGGISFLAGINVLAQDAETEMIIAVGKPPALRIREKIIDSLKNTGKTCVVCFMGDDPCEDDGNILYTTSLEECACIASSKYLGEDIKKAREELKKHYAAITPSNYGILIQKGFVRGLFTGGTLCYEAQHICSSILGPVYSNSPLKKGMKLEDSLNPVGNSFIDYGEDEFTQGRLHPMADPSFRAEEMYIQSNDTEAGVILFDVVLGYGCALNPTEEIIKVVKSNKRKNKPIFIAYICGTEEDPQKLSVQKEKLENAGVVICSSNAEAAYLAARTVSGKR